jgi:hypothetical protein
MSRGNETTATIADLFKAGRWDPRYWNPAYRHLDQALRRLKSKPLGDYVESITYGQVGQRLLSPQGKVRYLQVFNIRDTGIDFLMKPDRVASGSHNDPPRSRVHQNDILFTNNGFSGTQHLLGRCIAVHDDYGPVNVSQHIDVIRVTDIDPFYVAAFIRTPGFGQLQVQRLQYGVSSNELSFAQVKDLRIPELSEKAQAAVRAQYLAMARAHDTAMARKDTLHEKHSLAGRELEALAMEDGAYARAAAEAHARYEHLLSALEALLRGEVRRLAEFTP